MCARIFPARLFVPALVLLLSGCGLDHSALPGAEANDPDFVQGLQLKNEGRPQEALAAYLREISRRGDDAPEAHLDAGILYEVEIKDPVAAIYHFREYLRLRPQSPQAEMVRGYIEGSLRDFARKLPGDPMANSGGELGATVDRLEKENDQLRAQLVKLGVKPVNSGTSNATVTHSATGSLPGPVLGAAPGSGPATAEPLIQPAPPPPGSKTTKTYTVAAGDTLSVIAQKMYGNKGKWPEIQAANKDLLPTDKTPLKIGMELKIP